MTVGLALVYFQSENIDFAVIEVGLGGRLDSTNIISPLISVITNIGLDHTAFLGTTHEEIAGEKAGIIKPKTPVVIGEFTPVTKTVFEQKAHLEQAEIYFASELINEDYPCALLGDYQQYNKKTVLQTLKVLNEKGMITSTEANIKNGFLNVIKNTGLFGRWQQLQNQPLVICDTAHNAEGLLITMKQIQKQNFETLHVVLGVVNDKDLGSILPLFPKDAKYYFCKPAIPRGLDEAVLKMQAEKHELNGSLYRSVKEAYEDAINNASPRDFIYIGGSTFVVAEII